MKNFLTPNSIQSNTIMGSNTSASTDTNNIYLEQQYVETIEDKNAELLRQNELLRQENELLKLGNYNLKRDNNNLREDINNLRLVNKDMKAEKEELEMDKEMLDDKLMSLIYREIETDDQIEELKGEIEELKFEVEELKPKIKQLEKDKKQLEVSYDKLMQKLEHNRLVQKLELESNLCQLPKVAEKDDHKQFMLDCVIPVQTTEEHRIKQTELIESILRGDDYIIYNSGIGGGDGSHIILITNTGKIFQRRVTNYQRTYMWCYTDLKIKKMTKEIMDVIIYAMRIEYGNNGYVNMCPLLQNTGKHTW